MTLIARFQPNEGPPQYGVVENDRLLAIDDDIAVSTRPGARTYALRDVRILTPSVPSKIIAVGFNYYEHVKELGKEMPEEPFFSFRPPSCAIGQGESIVYPEGIAKLRFETELAVIIRRTAKNVTEAAAPEYILGYTGCNDLSASEFLETQPGRAKGYDTFFPFGPYVATDVNPMDLTIELRVNGELRQQANTGAVKFSPTYLVSFLSRIMTLCPGDVICTGAPPRLGFLEPGDATEITLQHGGTLRNQVVAAAVTA